MADESTPLLNDDAASISPSDPHSQFCLLIGIAPGDKPETHRLNKHLYTRVLRKRNSQNLTYSFTAALSNTLLLSQVVLGATLTALGASESSHVLITIFGVLNTVIAGLVAWLKSRGQPMRARMFRDDLDHVVDEIENSKTMWLGIRHRIHGYDEIDTDNKISVRSEVARLTRLYESAVKKYMQNNPDMYSMAGGVLDAITGLRARPPPGAQLPSSMAAPVAPVPEATTAGPAAPAPVEDADESPATAKEPTKGDKSADKADGSKDADESPATAKDTTKADKTTDKTDDNALVDGKTEDKAKAKAEEGSAKPDEGHSTGTSSGETASDAQTATDPGQHPKAESKDDPMGTNDVDSASKDD